MFFGFAAAHERMFLAGLATSARVALHYGICSIAEAVDQLFCVTAELLHCDVIFRGASLHEVDREFSFDGLSLGSCSSRKHSLAELCIVHSFFLGLG